MPIYSDVTREAVLAAIDECDELGRDRFLEKHGYGRARKYVIVHDGSEGEYDSKAILHVACSYQHPSAEPLSRDAFTGGLSTVVPHLLELDFTIKDLTTGTLLTQEDVGGSDSRPREQLKPEEEDLWTRARALALRDEAPSSLREVIDLLAQYPGRRFRAQEIVAALELPSIDSLKGILSHLTPATKRLGIPQTVEHTWFIQWEREPLFRYWLSQERADWWTGHRPRRFWAFAANPGVYQIQEAIKTLHHDWWTVGRSNVKPGDAVLIWKTRAQGERRGVIALAEVESEPTERDDSANPYWLDREAAFEQQARVRVRYHPLPAEVWLTEEPHDPLRHLSVSRARGGSVFRVERPDWEVVLRHIGGWPRDSLSPGERSNWTREELRRVVDAYVRVLKLKLRNEDYSTAMLDEELSKALPDRSNADIAGRLKEVSTTLVDSGLPYLEHWTPVGDCERLLRAVVDAHFADDDELAILLADLAESDGRNAKPIGDIDLDTVFTEPPQSPPRENDDRRRSRSTPRRIDYATREASNRRLGERGENFVYMIEQARLREANRADLAEDVEWVSETLGDGLGYDIRSFEEDGSPLFIEVKTTRAGPRMPFFISANEVVQSRQRGAAYRLYRVFNFDSDPQIFVLNGAVADTCDLRPTLYQARYGRAMAATD